MEPHQERLYLNAALKEPDIRHACHLVDLTMTFGDLLDGLSPTALECMRDYCAEWVKGRRGPMTDLRRLGLRW